MNFYNLFANNFTLIIPEIFLFTVINFLLIYGVLYNTSVYYNYINLVKNIGWLSIQSLLITICLILNNKISFLLLFNNILIHSYFTIFFKVFILIFSILSIFVSFNYIKNEKITTFEYQILTLIVVLGSLFVKIPSRLFSDFKGLF